MYSDQRTNEKDVRKVEKSFKKLEVVLSESWLFAHIAYSDIFFFT